MLTSQHIELEQSILGTLFLNTNLLVKAKDNIKPFMFQVEYHKRIYEGIIKMVEEGVKESGCDYTVIESRKDAIAYALDNGKKGDVIVLAGKGHETYQILNTGTIHFDEREVVREILSSRGK